MPRGHKRSTKMRNPSFLLGCSYIRFHTISAIFSLLIHYLFLPPDIRQKPTGYRDDNQSDIKRQFPSSRLSELFGNNPDFIVRKNKDPELHADPSDNQERCNFQSGLSIQQAN